MSVILAKQLQPGDRLVKLQRRVLAVKPIAGGAVEVTLVEDLAVPTPRTYWLWDGQMRVTVERES